MRQGFATVDLGWRLLHSLLHRLLIRALGAGDQRTLLHRRQPTPAVPSGAHKSGCPTHRGFWQGIRQQNRYLLLSPPHQPTLPIFFFFCALQGISGNNRHALLENIFMCPR